MLIIAAALLTSPTFCSTEIPLTPFQPAAFSVLAEDPDPKLIKRFARRLIRGLRKLDPKAEYVYEAEGHRLVESRSGYSVSLGNLYLEYQASPVGERKAFLARTAEALGREMVDDRPLEAIRDQLFPKVWSRAGMHQVHLERALKNRRKVEVPKATLLGEHLQIGLVLDEPDRVLGIDPDRIQS